MSTITKKYKNPPLLEALCEFVFADEGADVNKIESEFFQVVKAALSNRKEKKDFSVIINQKSAEVKESKGLVQFINETGNMMAQIGNKTFAVNYLKPYANWEEFSPFIMKMLRIYLTISSHKELTKVTVRYINKIDINADGIDTGDYFKLAMVIPEGISENIANFVLRTEHIYNDERDLLQLNLHMTPPDKPNVISFIFDTSFINVRPEKNSLENIEKWLAEAHITLNNAFESSLTQKCKALFD